MSRSPLFWLFVTAAAVRICAAVTTPPVHPDEIFQYVEPAFFAKYGVGQRTWEWVDGVRSWVLPFVNGSVLETLDLVGISSGAWKLIGLRILYGLASLCIVWAALKAADGAARRCNLQNQVLLGRLAAPLLCAWLAPIVWVSVQPLSETVSAVFALWAYALVEQQRNKPTRRSIDFALGVLVGLAAASRLTCLPVVVVPVVWRLATSQQKLRTLLSGAAGIGVILLLFGAVDKWTWGGFFSSFIGYVRFNFIERGAERFGVEPPSFFLQRAWNRGPLAFGALALLALSAPRAAWPYLTGFALQMAPLTLSPHKEERFAFVAWCLLAIAAGLGLQHHLTSALTGNRRGVFSRPRILLGAAGVLLLAIVADSARKADQKDYWGTVDTWHAQAWAGRDPTLTGVMVDFPIAAGGSYPLGKVVPQLPYDSVLLSNPLFTHVVTTRRSWVAQEAKAAGFTRVFRFGSAIVLRKLARPQPLQ